MPQTFSIRDAPTGRDQKYVLAIDLGTTSVKAALVNCETKDVVGPVAENSQATLDNPRPEENDPRGDLQDPKKIFIALTKCLDEFGGGLMDKVSKVALCGQMHGVVLWKDDPVEGASLASCSSLHTWQDQRCSDEFLAELETPLMGSSRVAKGYGCATLLWYAKHHPEYLTQFDRSGIVMDLLVCRLTKQSQPKMSPHIAASWGYFDVETNQWNKEILEKQGLPLCLLPDVATVGEVVGRVEADFCRIPKGTQVTVASGDMQCAFLSTLSQLPPSSFSSTAVLNVNTSAQLAFLIPKTEVGISFPSSLELVPFSEGYNAVVAAALNGGNCLAALVQGIRRWMGEMGAEAPTEEEVWRRIVALEVEDDDIQAEEVMLVRPLLFGERHCPSALASAANVSLASLSSLRHIVNAVCSGIVINLSEMAPWEVLDAAKVARVAAVGSCVERHPAIRRAVKREFRGRDPEVMKEGHSCVGAALFVLQK